MEIIDQRKIPGIGGIDFVICSHLHPFLEIGKYRHSLHGGHGGSCNERQASILCVFFPP